MSETQHGTEPSTPFRTNTYRPDPSFDPHPLMRVVEAMTRQDQSKFNWKKLVPYRRRCAWRVVINIPRIPAGVVAGLTIALGWTWNHICKADPQCTDAWNLTNCFIFGVMFLHLSVLPMLYTVIVTYDRVVAQFFSREYRWTENGPGTRFLIRELRGRFLKLIPHLRLNKDWKGATQNGPEIEAARSALGDWISWLMALTHPHTNLCLPLPQSGASAVHLSQDLLQLLQTLEELNSPPLDTPSWRLSNLDAVAIQLRLKLALVQPLLEALIGPPKYLIPWRRHPLA